MARLILHIPHSSTNIPLAEGYTINGKELNSEILKLTDWYTDDLFQNDIDILIKADFSRLFCDPERFVDDKQEVMAQFGMGVLYEKTDSGKRMREVYAALKEKVLQNYYWVHHKNFKNAVQEELEQNRKALILDCHSFPSTPLVRDLDKSTQRPDFNIGTDPFHTPQHLIDFSKDFFESNGFSLGIDWPYAGSIVPLEYYRKNKNVSSIMLEVNRRLYLKEPSNLRSEDYDEIKSLVQNFVQDLRRTI